MPLPNDQRVVALANDLIQQFDKIFGLHPGYRPAHAKGVMLTGSFSPSSQARSLTNAPHIVRSGTPVTVRFSNSTGLPTLPDNVPEANPRGMAIRFNLADHVHTDIVAHSTDSFPTRDGNEFLEFLRAVAASGPDVASPKPVEVFLGSHPMAAAFIQTPKPQPVSFGTDAYFSVSAFQFKNEEGKTSFGRYRIVPDGGTEFIKDEAVESLSQTYLFDELAERITKRPIRFKILVQVAAAGDEPNDATVRWPEDRKLLEFGTFELTALVPDNAKEQKQIIFDPIPRTEGIEPTADPLFELRAAVYLISGRRRRAATQES
jgi:catalase